MPLCLLLAIHAAIEEAIRRGRRRALGTALLAMGALIEAAKLAGVEPRAYLGQAARRPIRNPGTVTPARDFERAEWLGC